MNPLVKQEIAGLAFYATEPLAGEPLVRQHVCRQLERKFWAHARKVALAKVGRRPEPVPLEGEVNVRARAAMTKALARALAKVKKQAIALVRQQGGLKKADDDSSDLPSKIAKELDLSEVVYAAIETGDDLSEAAVMAAQHTIRTLGLDDDEKLTDLVNDKAVAIARKQAAMLVGRHYDADGNLVESADPEYQIDETTRDGIRQLIADGLEQNVGTDQIAKNINDSFIVSEKRAGLIARSEVARVNSLSVLDSLFSARDDAGVNVKKVWLTAGDDLVDDVCQANEDAGPIDLEDDFPSGDDAPLAHPFCRCVLTNIVLDDEDAEKLAKLGMLCE